MLWNTALGILYFYNQTHTITQKLQIHKRMGCYWSWQDIPDGQLGHLTTNLNSIGKSVLSHPLSKGRNSLEIRYIPKKNMIFNEWGPWDRSPSSRNKFWEQTMGRKPKQPRKFPWKKNGFSWGKKAGIIWNISKMVLYFWPQVIHYIKDNTNGSQTFV